MEKVKTVDTIQQISGYKPKKLNPNPQEISKWSIGRKLIKKQLSCESQKVRNLTKRCNELEREVRTLKVKLKLSDIEIPDSFETEKYISFKVDLVNQSENTITYQVTNSDLDYYDTIDVEIEDMMKYFDEDFDSTDIINYIENNYI